MRTFTVSVLGITVLEIQLECDCPPPAQPPKLEAGSGGQFERDFGFDA